jgi:hypothetical protein
MSEDEGNVAQDGAQRDGFADMMSKIINQRVGFKVTIVNIFM